MAIQLIERPYKFSFSKNEARYVFYITNPLSEDCAVDIKLFYHGVENVNAPAIFLKQVRLYPNTNGEVIFYANEYLQSIPEENFHIPGDGIIKSALTQQRYFFIEFKQVTKVNPNNAWVLAERTKKRVLLMGGIETQKFERNNFFLNYYTPGKKWLTWLQSGRFVGKDQELYLSWLNTTAYTDNFKLFAKVFFTDGTDDEMEVAFTNLHKGFLFHFKAGAEQLDLQTLGVGKTIHYYELRIQRVAEVLANPFRFYVDYNHQYHWFDWLFLNSTGGIDGLRIKGNYERDTEREISSAGNVKSMISINEPFKKGEFIHTGITLTKKWKGDVGYLPTPDEQESLLDLLSSIIVYERVDGKLLQVLILNKNQITAGSLDKRWSFPLEWRYAFSNDVFTPEKTLLGAGDNDEAYDEIVTACGAPTGLTATVVGTENGISAVAFNWTHVGNVGSTIETKTNGTSIWTDVFVLDFSFPSNLLVFVADGRLMNWRLKLKCANEDESIYVNGPNFQLPTDANACAIPTGLTLTKGVPASGMIPFTFAWAHALPADNYTLEYKAVAAMVWTSVNVNALTTIISFADDGTEYMWRVKALCGAGSESIFVDGYNFVSDSSVTCSLPIDLVVIKLTTLPDSIIFRLEWDHPDANSFDVEYMNLSQNYGDFQTTSDKFLEIEVPKTLGIFNWTVSAECFPPGNYSSPVNGPTFRT